MAGEEEKMLSIIACIASGNRALGLRGKLIYRIPEDMRQFKWLTKYRVVIMGRETFKSIGGHLHDREEIVLSRDKDYNPGGVVIARSLEEALGRVRDDRESFIIGGGQVFQQTIGIVDKLYLTIVEGNPEADSFFPDYSDFKHVVSEKCRKYHDLRYKFLTLER